MPSEPVAGPSAPPTVPPVVAIVGATASGKTGLSLDLAERLGVGTAEEETDTLMRIVSKLPAQIGAELMQSGSAAPPDGRGRHAREQGLRRDAVNEMRMP